MKAVVSFNMLWWWLWSPKIEGRRKGTSVGGCCWFFDGLLNIVLGPFLRKFKSKIEKKESRVTDGGGGCLQESKSSIQELIDDVTSGVAYSRAPPKPAVTTAHIPSLSG